MITRKLYNSAMRLAEHRESAKYYESLLIEVLSDEASTRGSWKELAATIGVSQQFLSDVRHGRRDVSERLLCKIVKAGAK